MPATHRLLLCTLLVAGLHALGLAALFMPGAQAVVIDIKQPAIQGVLVMQEPQKIPTPVAAAKTQPEPPSQPRPEPHKKPSALPLARASDRALREQATPEREAAKATESSPSKPTQATPLTHPVLPPSAVANESSNTLPTYPAMSRRLREEGMVVVDILIKADGSVGEIKLKTSSGYKRLDESALKAVAKWHYQPATQAGEAIDFWYEQPVEFTLHE